MCRWYSKHFYYIGRNLCFKYFREEAPNNYCIKATHVWSFLFFQILLTKVWSSSSPQQHMRKKKYTPKYLLENTSTKSKALSLTENFCTFSKNKKRRPPSSRLHGGSEPNRTRQPSLIKQTRVLWCAPCSAIQKTWRARRRRQIKIFLTESARGESREIAHNRE